MNPTAPPESLGSPSARTYRIPASIPSSSRTGSFVSCQTGMTAPGTPAWARKTSMSGIVITVGSFPHEKRVHLPFRLQFPDRPVCRVAVRVRADDNLVVISRLSARPLHHSRPPSVFFEPFPKRLGRFPVPEGGHLDHQFPCAAGVGRSLVGSLFPGCRLHEENGGGVLLRQGFPGGEGVFGLRGA